MNLKLKHNLQFICTREGVKFVPNCEECIFHKGVNQYAFKCLEPNHIKVYQNHPPILEREQKYEGACPTYIFKGKIKVLL